MKYLQSKIGRLRLFGFLEGMSLLALVFVAMPFKYAANNPSLVKAIGPVHGILFVLFVFNTISVATEYRWKFSEITWKLLVSCLIPFGTMYIDHTILKSMHQAEKE